MQWIIRVQIDRNTSRAACIVAVYLWTICRRRQTLIVREMYSVLLGILAHSAIVFAEQRGYELVEFIIRCHAVSWISEQPVNEFYGKVIDFGWEQSCKFLLLVPKILQFTAAWHLFRACLNEKVVKRMYFQYYYGFLYWRNYGNIKHFPEK